MILNYNHCSALQLIIYFLHDIVILIYIIGCCFIAKVIFYVRPDLICCFRISAILFVCLSVGQRCVSGQTLCALT